MAIYSPLVQVRHAYRPLSSAVEPFLRLLLSPFPSHPFNPLTSPFIPLLGPGLAGVFSPRASLRATFFRTRFWTLFFRDLGGVWTPSADFGVPFWAPKSTKVWSKFEPKSGITFFHPFLASGGLRDHFRGSFWRCFLAAQPRSGQNRENHEK